MIDVYTRCNRTRSMYSMRINVHFLMIVISTDSSIRKNKTLKINTPYLVLSS